MHLPDFALDLIALSPLALIKGGGIIAIALVIFAETGLLIGIIFPGDSLLFIAGFLASNGYLDVVPLVSAVVVAAILGDSVGYWFGAAVGETLFTREDSRFFKKEYVARTQRFFAKYGARAVVLARFVPVVRTFAPILAGVGEMPYARFIAYNVVGAFLWGAGMVALGFFLERAFPGSDRYLFVIALAVIILSLVPVAWNLIAHRASSRK